MIRSVLFLGEAAAIPEAFATAYLNLFLEENIQEGDTLLMHAIDCLGGEMMGKCLRYLRHGARWIMIAALAGTKTEVDLKNIYVRNVRIVGSTLRSRTPEVKAKILAGIV